MEPFADVHQHVLWGLDDGPQSAQEMHDLLQQDAEEGVGIVYATSHAYPAVQPFDMERYRERLAEANDYCSSQDLNVKVLPGCEIHYCDSVPDSLSAGKLPTLGDTRYALIEFSTDVSLDRMRDGADCLYRAGFTPVVAHVERYACLRRFPGRAAELRDEYGLLFQMNCDTILAPRGYLMKRFVLRLLDAKAIDIVASDAHDVLHRPVRMKEAYEALCRLQGELEANRMMTFGQDKADNG